MNSQKPSFNWVLHALETLWTLKCRDSILNTNTPKFCRCVHNICTMKVLEKLMEPNKLSITPNARVKQSIPFWAWSLLASLKARGVPVHPFSWIRCWHPWKILQLGIICIQQIYDCQSKQVLARNADSQARDVAASCVLLNMGLVKVVTESWYEKRGAK